MNKTRTLGSMVILMLLGFALRFFRLNAVPLRGDEAFTVLQWMRQPLTHTLAVIATVDPQAPLSYALYRGWALIFGSSEDVVRILPALVNVIGVPVMYALGHRLRGWRLGLLAAFLWAINPYQIWHAQDARNYAIWAVLSPLAIWQALRALDHRSRLHWLLYILAAALAAYVYYLELFFVLALNLYVIAVYWHDRRLLIRWLGAQAAIGLILAPWYIQPRLLSGGGYGGTSGYFDASQWISRFIPALIFGDRLLPANVIAVIAPLLLLALLIGLMLWGRRNWRQVLLFGLVGVVPLLLLGLISLKLNVFEPRYILAAAPAYLLVLAVLITHSRLLSIPVFFAVVLICSYSLYDYYFLPDYAKTPDWRALVTYLHAHVQPSEWVTQASADPSFTFYCTEYHVATNCDDQLPANPRQSQAEIDQLLTMRSQLHSAIWYVAQPQSWPNASDPENWLTANLQQVRSTSANGLRIQEFKPWEVGSDELSSAPLATFGDAAQLVGVQASIEPTNTLNVWLDWRAQATTSASLKVFVHLTAADQILTQDDHYPQDGRIATNSWVSGIVYRDVYTLPLTNVPSGDYALVVGFYDPQTNRRLPVGDGDSFTIQTIHVP